MPLTNYLYPPEVAASMAAKARTAFAARKGAASFDDNAARVIGQRMLDHPERYVEFGPYWWAVKNVLNAAGFNFGDAGAPILAGTYCGPDAGTTLVLAEAFKDQYRATWFSGTATFDLGEEVPYMLEDPDMMARIAGVVRASA